MEMFQASGESSIILTLKQFPTANNSFRLLTIQTVSNYIMIQTISDDMIIQTALDY